MTNYTNILEDTIWCSDRSISSNNNYFTYYGSYGRLSKPSLECVNESDREPRK